MHSNCLKREFMTRYYKNKTIKKTTQRRALVGRGDRSEKIRTYNYPQNRVTDHRINLTLQRLDAIMAGRLELILEPLHNEFQRRLLVGGHGEL